MITPELVAQFPPLCGFASMPHIKGVTSVFSLKLGIDGGVACLCGAATINLLNAALESVFTVDEPWDVLSYGYDKIEFPTPNIAGGSVNFTFKVLSTEATVFPIKKLKMKLPMSNISFECIGVNTRTQKEVIRAIWNLGYIATSEINNNTEKDKL